MAHDPAISRCVSHDGFLLTAETLLRVLRQILEARDGPVAMSIDLDSRLDELGIDSLIMAELIVELEDQLSVLLEIRPDGQLNTVADLRNIVQPVSALEAW
jgi:acyl carrier protein